MAKPISPQEAKVSKRNLIPEFVFEAVNSLISEGLSVDGSVRLMQRDIVKRIMQLSPVTISAGEIYNNKWLDIESSYEEAGWKVLYDKPAYNESYEAYFKFKPK